MRFTVLAASTARMLPPREGQPAMRADHLTVRGEDGASWETVMFTANNAILAQPGSIIEGDLGDPDGFDPTRRRLRRAAAAPAPATATPGATPTTGMVALDERARRIERQHSQEMALRYLDVLSRAHPDRMSLVSLMDVAAVTSAFQADLNEPSPPARDMEAREPVYAPADGFSG